MPEFQAPGVYVEEVAFRAKTIEPVGTTLTGFVGPCRSGPVAGVPPLLTSLGDFERRYGDGAPLHFSAQTLSNDLWHAVRVFFLEGGQALHVSRVFRAGAADDGCARLSLGADGAVQLRARHPGAAGNLGLRFSFRLGASLLQAQARPDGSLQPVLAPQADGALVWLRTACVPQLPGPLAGRRVEALPLYQARRDASGNWWLQGAPAARRLDDFAPDLTAGSRDAACVLSVSVTVMAADGKVWGEWAGLPPQALLQALGAATTAAPPPPIVLTTTGAAGEAAGLGLLRALLPPLAVTPADWAAAGQDELAALAAQLARGVTARFTLAGGHDGVWPEVADYVGELGANGPSGLLPFEALADIALVAAPGGGGRAGAPAGDAAGIARALIDHAERMRYRLALVDAPEGLGVDGVRRFRAGLESRRAALYHPWVLVADPHAGQALQLPPSGFVAGICVRNDILRGVHRAPANEVLRSAIGFAAALGTGEQEVLNPEGINLLRTIPHRGHVVWGARTLSHDPQARYVNVSRCLASLVRAIEQGTQWVVFEPPGPALWDRVSRSIRDFLLLQWQGGALQGDRPDNAFFVRCDHGTMTADDLARGRLVAEVGVALLKPAEFLVFRVAQRAAA
ncbi:phage tail sheath subtilisin-like domain-containing protein [Pelomonas sp. UHG3]|uniref:Phage tail sheath subtilisin-like domain-containing protein n=1 Tax=Roseateles hydrophilus TaxID=2975054 RepID=A0ACC6CD67_9BURK|nr:phage tail sheath subtilisin-like domain-containing protein [Pelomonas sp. UHG3]MCY4746322.1 phage tail sheath subtilisin-like domain-containing protein [Pelomonas sp. UHG3]